MRGERVAGMRPEHREALRSLHLVLAQQMQTDELLHHLLAERVLTEEMVQRVEDKRTNFKKNTALLLLLPCRGPAAFETFVRALSDTEQSHLSQLLQEEILPHSTQGPGFKDTPPAPDEDEDRDRQAKKLCIRDVRESSVDAGDGAVGFPVLSCSPDFYTQHRDTAYQLISRPKGLALIISNVQFGGAGDLVDRKGGDEDQRSLSQIFTILGFTVTCLQDQTAEEMKSELQRFSRLPNHRSVHSTVVAVLSHGVEGAVYGVDGQLVQLEDIFRLFDNDTCPQLQNKPKVFLIQACRGDDTDNGVDLQDGRESLFSMEGSGGETLRVKLPTRSDIICGYACLKGTAALRNTRRGSWYVQALMQVLASHAKDTHVADMLVKVNALIKEREGFAPGTEHHRCKEMSEYSSTLCKDLYLFPGLYE